MDIQSISIGEKGVQKSLGKLEAEIMRVLWKSKEPQSAREVTDKLSTKKPVSFNAVSTVLNRLEKKKLVEKKAKGKRYSFVPTVDKKSYSLSIINSGLRSIFSDTKLLSAAGLSGDLAEDIDQDALALLKKFLNKKDEK